MLQMLERGRGGHPEVDQAGQLIDPDSLQSLNHREAGFDRPEQAAVSKYPLEGMVQDGRLLFWREALGGKHLG